MYHLARTADCLGLSGSFVFEKISQDYKKIMIKPKVSSVIATHNNKNNIEGCIDSLSSCSFSDIEIIAVDVNSADGTKGLLEQMADENENIIYLSDGMGSMGHARNIGMDRARADYIMFVEPDDVIKKNAFEYMSSSLDENTDADRYRG